MSKTWRQLPTWEDLLDEAEIAQLQESWKTTLSRRISLPVGQAFFDEMAAETYPNGDRRGEVILIVLQPDGEVLLHTKAFYPPGAFRLLSGGIKPQESVPAALEREIVEETGLALRPQKMLGIIYYELINENRIVPFVSYLFSFRNDGRPLRLSHDEEQISEFREVAASKLPQVSDELKALAGKWHDWGCFRAPAHQLVFELLSG